MQVADIRSRLAKLWNMQDDGEFLTRENNVLLVENISNWSQAIARVLGRDGRKSIFFFGTDTVEQCEKVRNTCESNHIFAMFDKNLVDTKEQIKTELKKVVDELN